MYNYRHNPQEPKSFKCKECGSNLMLFSKGKLTCRNCGYVVGNTFNKYGSKRTKAKDGKARDSKFEASIADSLLLRKKAGDIKDYESQYRVEMWAYDEIGNKAMCKRHKIDFRIHHNDGSYELLEAKGVETSDYKDRRKWLEIFWLPFNKDHIYTVIKQK